MDHAAIEYFDVFFNGLLPRELGAERPKFRSNRQ